MRWAGALGVRPPRLMQTLGGPQVGKPVSQSGKCLQLSYTLLDWQDELQALRANGDPPPCPCCSRRGFYEPKLAEPNRRYRACKFCGFWQDVDESPREVIRYECQGPGHWVADWKVPTKKWTCSCGKTYSLDQRVPWPADDPTHRWNQAPASGTQEDFRRFWSGRGMKVGPFGIP